MIGSKAGSSSAGSLDGGPPLTLAAHIYTDEAGAYYELFGEAERFTREAWSRGGWQRFRGDWVDAIGCAPGEL